MFLNVVWCRKIFCTAALIKEFKVSKYLCPDWRPTEVNNCHHCCCCYCCCCCCRQTEKNIERTWWPSASKDGLHTFSDCHRESNILNDNKQVYASALAFVLARSMIMIIIREKVVAEFTRYSIGAPHDAVNPDNSAPFALTPPCQVLQLTKNTTKMNLKFLWTLMQKIITKA